MYKQYMYVLTVFPLLLIFSGNVFEKIFLVIYMPVGPSRFFDHSRQNTGTWLSCPNFHIQRLGGTDPKEFYNSKSTL
jgi:hypothetical protein